MVVLRRLEQAQAGVVVNQALAVEGVGLPVRDIGVIGESQGAVREGRRGGGVAHFRGQPDAVGQQVLDLVEFLRVVGEFREHAERLRQRAFLLGVEAAGQGQRADHPVPDLLRMRRGLGQVLPRDARLAAVEADDGGDPVIAAGHARVPAVVLEDGNLTDGVIPAAGMEQQLAQAAPGLGVPDREPGPVGKLLGLAGRGEGLPRTGPGRPG